MTRLSPDKQKTLPISPGTNKNNQKFEKTRLSPEKQKTVPLSPVHRKTSGPMNNFSQVLNQTLAGNVAVAKPETQPPKKPMGTAAPNRAPPPQPPPKLSVASVSSRYYVPFQISYYFKIIIIYVFFYRLMNQ